MNRVCLIALILLVISPGSLLAKPVEVLIFPSGAIVTEERSVEVVDGAAMLSLPSVAAPATLRVATVDSGATVSGLQFDSVLETGGNYQGLRDKIEVTEAKLQDVEDQSKARVKTLEFWKVPQGERFTSAEEYRKLADHMFANSEKLNREISQLSREKKEIKEELQELQRQLDEATRKEKRIWSVQVAMTGAGSTVPLRYSYKVDNADWKPAYMLDARPADKKVLWDWTANVGQRTSVDWKDVQLLVATAEPVFTLAPPKNRPWIIRDAYARYKPKPMKKAMVSYAPSEAASLQADMVTGFVRAEPVRKAGTLFDIYDLGRQTIIAGERYQLNIRKGSWPATYDYLLRPLQSPQVFLLAKLEFEELLPMPRGNASILVEGVYVGKRRFDVLEKKLDISFGNDPQIMVKVKPTREAGKAGVFGGDKTQAWNWNILITNNKNVTVNLRMEDSLPQVEDERIKFVEKVTDNVDQEEKLVKWEIELKPGEKKSVEYSYKIRYPDDMKIELGR